MAVQIRKLQFDSERLPGRVRVVLSDGDSKKESTVWISAQFELDKHSPDRLPLLALAALDELQRLIEQGRAHASRGPDAPNQ